MTTTPIHARDFLGPDSGQHREWLRYTTGGTLAQVLVGSYPAEWEDVLDVLGRCTLRKSDVVAAGGGKSKS
jgi:hypothetical protein